MLQEPRYDPVFKLWTRADDVREALSKACQHEGEEPAACQHEGEEPAVWEARYRLVRRILAANTPAEARTVLTDAHTWLRDHPGDITVITACEQAANILPVDVLLHPRAQEPL